MCLSEALFSSTIFSFVFLKVIISSRLLASLLYALMPVSILFHSILSSRWFSAKQACMDKDNKQAEIKVNIWVLRRALQLLTRSSSRSRSNEWFVTAALARSQNIWMITTFFQEEVDSTKKEAARRFVYSDEQQQQQTRQPVSQPELASTSSFLTATGWAGW